MALSIPCPDLMMVADKVSEHNAQTVAAESWRDSGAHGVVVAVDDRVAREVAVALVYNGISHAVMMATPDDLEDFALGFSLSENILASAGELYALELVAGDLGIEVVMTISAERFAALKHRRRNLTGRTGCGLCGAESLREAIRPLPQVDDRVKLNAGAIQAAVAQLNDWQPLQAVTGAVHGAAWCDLNGAIQLLREDVGRHNALDKLLGALHKKDSAPFTATEGFVLISSRASYEMVAKSAALGVEIVAAVSAPTALAIHMAQQAGVTLIGFARPGRHMVYSHPQRLAQVT